MAYTNFDDDGDFGWGESLDISATKTNVTSSERRMLNKVRDELPRLSKKAWEELFDLVKQEYHNRK